MAPPRKRRSRRRSGSRKRTVPQHSSVPTGRDAYAETRAWLLATHGPVCAYCARTFTVRTLTLDHVTPRRGQSAYDRRDNLVLACTRCNTAKADKPFLVYLLAQRSRAERLLRYGQHLSDGILDILRHMAGDSADQPLALAPAARPEAPRVVYGPDDDESPYRDQDSPYRMTA
jgi:5-methylcytosine-specific restriction endonuclease McrA